MNIWILDNRGINLFYKSYMDLPVDEFLVSGLLAALNQFILVQFDQPIESIDMAGFRWIYIIDDDYNLIFVASSYKDVNAETLRARLNVIKETFINEYIKDNHDWNENWVGDLEVFRPFEVFIDKYYSQWTQAEKMTSSAEFFDVLGVFQQILNLLRKTIENHINSEDKEDIYEAIEDLFDTFRNQLYIKKDQELSKISFDRESGFNIISISPKNCDVSVVKKQITYLMRGVIRIIRDKIGLKSCLNYFSDERIYKYIFNNIVLLKKLDLDTYLLQLFLID